MHVDLSNFKAAAFRHCLRLLDHPAAGEPCALHHADEWEQKSEGLLDGLGARVRQEVEKRRAASAPTNQVRKGRKP